MQLAVLPQRGFPDIVDGVKQTPQADVPAGGAAGARGAGGGGRVPAASGVHGEGRGLRAAGGGPAAAPDWTFWRLAPAAVIAATAAASASQQPCNCRLAAGSSSQPLPYLTRALPSALPLSCGSLRLGQSAVRRAFPGQRLRRLHCITPLLLRNAI